MPVFTYRCYRGHEWDERRDRDDPNLRLSLQTCPDDECWETDLCGCCDYPSLGTRVFAPTTAVYYRGKGWAKHDRYWEKVNAEQ